VEPRVVPAPDQIALAVVLTWLWAAIVICFASAAVTALTPAFARLSPVLSTLGGAWALILGIALLAGGGTVSAGGGSVLLGFAPIDVRYDGLSGAFLLALGFSASAASLSVVGSRPRSRIEAAAYPLFLLSMVLVLGAANAFAFLFAWELMALLSTLLVVGLRPSRSVVSAGYLYLAMTHAAAAALLVAFAILSAAAGGLPGFAAWRAAAPALTPVSRDIVFILVFIGFATKAGALPLHAWLPRAHPVAPSHVSAVMSGVMIKTGIYGLVRIVFDVLGGGPDWWGLLIIGVGVASAVLGVLYALMQHDLKRLLAFHSIENIGIILLGVGCALVLAAHGATDLAALSLAAALLHSVNHAVFKTLLFLCAGAVLHSTGLRDLNRLGGLARTMPLTALTFGVGAAAISGLPPLNGFASEWLVFQGLLGTAGTAAVPPLARFAAAAAIGGLALTAALAVACFVKATGVAFLGLPRTGQASTARETTRPVGAAVGFLAATCVALGLGAGPASAAMTTVARSIAGAGAQLSTGVATVTAWPRPGEAATYAALAGGLLLLASMILIALLVTRPRTAARRVHTWTCGIAPEPAFQYTATSFAKPIRLFFHRILLPEREVEVDYHPGTAFPVSIRYRSEITLVLEDRVFRPGHALSIRAARLVRRLQGGAIQLYIAYTVVAVLVLLLWAR
jgi:hydrogenase-4 component B